MPSLALYAGSRFVRIQERMVSGAQYGLTPHIYLQPPAMPFLAAMEHLVSERFVHYKLTVQATSTFLQIVK